MTYIDYDPDELPERSFDTIAELTRSVLLRDAAQAHAQGRYIGERYERMTAKRGPTDIWVLESRALDVEFDDGSPVVRTDFIFTLDPQGRPLSKQSLPGLIAQKFLELGVSASWKAVGMPNSAVGRTFRFTDYTRPRRRGPQPEYADTRHWPIELLPAGYTGEKRIIPRTVADSSFDEAIFDTQPDIVDVLREALVGKSPAQMFDVVLGNASLKQAGYVFGVPVLDAANDGSLVKVLADNGVLVVDQGVFRVPV